MCAHEDPVVLGDSSETPTGLYLYGVVEGCPDRVSDGVIGLDGAQVRCLEIDGLGVLVHGCAAAPYASQDRETVVRWAAAHAAVLCGALVRYPAVLPFAFNTIVQGPCPDQRLAQWIGDHRTDVCLLLDRLRGRVEYGVHIEVSAPPAPPEVDPNLPAGVAYLLRYRPRPKAWPSQWRQAAVRRLQRLADVSVEVRGCVTPGPEPSCATLLRAACLVDMDAVGVFLCVAQEPPETEAFRIEVTGPWPAYSFLNPPPRDRASR